MIDYVHWRGEWSGKHKADCHFDVRQVDHDIRCRVNNQGSCASSGTEWKATENIAGIFLRNQHESAAAIKRIVDDNFSEAAAH